ncbi:MAG: hypothetical protein AAF633_08700, partial [Chloroflexota bacterium]
MKKILLSLSLGLLILVLAACTPQSANTTEPEAEEAAVMADESDDEMMDDEMMDEEMSDEEMSDDEMSDDEMMDEEMMDEEMSDDEMMDEESHDDAMMDELSEADFSEETPLEIEDVPELDSLETFSDSEMPNLEDVLFDAAEFGEQG